MLLVAMPLILREAWQTCRLNLLAEYVGRKGAMTVRVRLFRRQVCTVRWNIRRSPGEYGLAEMGRVGIWERDGDDLILRLGENRAVFRPVAGGRDGALVQSVGFNSYQSSPELSLEGVELAPCQ